MDFTLIARKIMPAFYSCLLCVCHFKLLNLRNMVFEKCKIWLKEALCLFLSDFVLLNLKRYWLVLRKF